MNEKQRRDLDVISRIDDDIIEKNTQKRISLFGKRRRNKNIKWFIPSAAAAVLVAVMLPLLLTLLIKQVPIYEGMTVLEGYNGTSSASVEPVRRGNGFDFLSDKKDNNGNNGNGNNGNNGNHYGNDKKPVDEIIEDDPSLTLEIPDQKMYYAEPNQDIYINVHISNPDSFEILSFTLNGKKYSSYMFEDGSDMENLILKVNVGDANGVIEYTIDAIKYVDGTDIKDVVMEGDRTIKVGVYSAGIQPAISASNEFIGINEVSFDVNLSDKFELIERCGGKAYAFICDDESALGSKPIELGENKIEFKNLKTGTTYRYGVFAYYDSLDGKGMGKHILFEKEFTTKTIVAVGNPIIEQESISFSVVFNELFESKKLSAMTLYLGENRVEEVEVSGDVAKKTFTLTKLLSNNEYKLVIAYENLGRTETVEYTFKTLEKATPDLTINETEKTQTSFKFDIAVTDVDKVGAITKIELIHGEDVTNVENLETREFADLLSNNDYTVKVTYTYDLNDGVGKQTLVKELTVRTKEKLEPTFTINDLTSDTYTVNGSYDQTNVDNTLISYTISIFKGDELVTENADKKIVFDSLDYYTEYTVKITYTFDANDGKGVQTKTEGKSVKTLPYIDVIECNVVNTSAVSEGDTIFMQVKLDNPLNMAVEAVVINGEKYKVTGQSTTERIFVEIVYTGQFAGGDTYLKVDEIVAKIDDVTITEVPKSELSDNVFINGRLEVLKFECVNNRFEPVDWVFPNEKIYIMLTLDNSTGYTVDEIKFSNYNGYSSDGIKCTKIDNNHWYFDPINYFNSETGWNSIELNSLSYHNEHVNKNLSSLDMKESYFKLASEDKVYVSTPEDLKQMKDGYYYELTGDIDLSGLEWYGNEFCGVFEGNGYSIKNLSYVSTVNSSVDLGLFTLGTGFIKNLNMEKVTIIAECTAEDKDWIDLYCGSLVARPYGLLVNNCTTDEDSFISITTSVKEGRWISVGGLLGGDMTDSANDAAVRITDCVNRASCSVTGSQSFVGGIIGNGSRPNALIEGCINYGTVSGTYSAGGIIGHGDSGDDNSTIVRKCINYGAITGKDEGGAGGISGGGGLIGNCINYGSVSIENKSNETENNTGGIVSWAGNASVFNCLNVGTVKGNGKRTGGIAGERWNSEIYSCINLGQVSSKGGEHCALYYDDLLGKTWNYANCYAIKPHREYEPSCTIDQLNSKEFYTETLGWSEEIWDFSELDFENGKYPKLK